MYISGTHMPLLSVDFIFQHWTCISFSKKYQIVVQSFDMALTEAKVSCKCGKVVLKFFNPQPKICLECGCVDCKQAMVWGEEQGGPKVCIKINLFLTFPACF